MEYQSRRPFSAKSRLESTQPLTSTTPVTRIPVRSNSPSADEAIAHYNSERARALGDSARAHGSPSKLRSVSRNQHRPDSAVLPASKGCSTFVKLLLVVLLFCWQGLVFLVIYLTLRSAQDLNHQIIVKGDQSVDNMCSACDHQNQISCCCRAEHPVALLAFVRHVQDINITGLPGLHACHSTWQQHGVALHVLSIPL